MHELTIHEPFSSKQVARLAHMQAAHARKVLMGFILVALVSVFIAYIVINYLRGLELAAAAFELSCVAVIILLGCICMPLIWLYADTKNVAIMASHSDSEAVMRRIAEIQSPEAAGFMFIVTAQHRNLTKLERDFLSVYLDERKEERRYQAMMNEANRLMS